MSKNNNESYTQQIERLENQVQRLEKKSKNVDLLKPSLDTKSINYWCSEILGEIIDELYLELIFDAHRAAKLRKFNNQPPIGNVCINGLDVYGQKTDKYKSESFKCDNCDRTVVASRFAPHLENCMGMGRTSRSSRRQNTDRKITQDSSSEADDDNDEDYIKPKSRSRSLARGRSPNSRSPNGRAPAVGSRTRSSDNTNSNDNNSMEKTENGVDPSDNSTIDSSNSTDNDSLLRLPPSSSSTPSRYKNKVAGTTIEDLKEFTQSEFSVHFNQNCSVASTLTGKLCTKSLRCPQHTDAQRKEIRDEFLIGNGKSNKRSVKDREEKDIFFSPINEYVDIDGDGGEEIDMSESALLRHSSNSRSVSPINKPKRKKKNAWS